MNYTTNRRNNCKTNKQRSINHSIFENIFNEMMHVPMNRFVTQKDVQFTYPATNISESEDKFVLQLMLPGINKNDISIDINNHQLIISNVEQEGEETVDKEAVNESIFKLKEFDFNKFERKFTLPNTILTDNIKAKMSKGILEITLYKNPEIKKNISIS